jgi:DNA-binding winged helix-turn-helix (wHTH) protein
VVVRDGDETALTAQEAAFLRVLAAAAGDVVSRDDLLRDVWGHRVAVVTRAVDNAAARLRAKIELDPANPAHLLTERGAGYRLVGARWEARPAGRAAPLPVVPPTDLVGRHRDIAAVLAALDASPVVTVLGAPGVGKSAVARAAAAARGGVEVAAADLATVAVPPGTVVLVDDVGDPTPLLPAIAGAVQRGARLLVTARRPVGTKDERRVRLRPLPPDDAARLAGELAAVPGMADGIPLAIELAKSASRLLPPSELGSVDALAQPSRRPARHRRWVDAVRPSWEDLDSEAQALALRVARDGGVAAGAAPWEALVDLVDRSLIEREGDRFRMPPVLARAILRLGGG